MSAPDDENPRLLDSKDNPLGGGPNVRVRTPKFLSHPIIVGMISVLFATAIGGVYWLGQQRFQAKESAKTKTIDESLTAERNVVGLTGRQLSAYRIFVGAFEDKLGPSQLKERRIQANAIQQDWDMSIPTVELELHRYFPSDSVAAAWHEVKVCLGTLDRDAIGIRDETNSGRRRDEIESFYQDFSTAEESLKKLTALMDEAIAEIRKQRAELRRLKRRGFGKARIVAILARQHCERDAALTRQRR